MNLLHARLLPPAVVLRAEDFVSCRCRCCCCWCWCCEGTDAADLGRLGVGVGSKLDGGVGSGEEGAVVVVVVAPPRPAEPAHSFELVPPVLVTVTSPPTPCVCCCVCVVCICCCCWSAREAVDRGLKGPEPGSGGHAGTSCDGKGKGTSVLALAPSLVAALALAAVLVPAREGKGAS